MTAERVNYNTASVSSVDAWAGGTNETGPGADVLAGATSVAAAPPKRSKLGMWVRLGALALLVTAATLLLTMFPVRAYLLGTTTWVRGHLYLGTLTMILVFWVAIPLCVPSTALEMIAGLLFGVLHAVVVIVIGKTVGSLLAFLLVEVRPLEPI